MKKVALYTLGCRVNQYETEAMSESFIKKGYEIVDFEEYADVYIVNTCTVTNIGDKKSRKMLRKAKKINPSAIVVAAGCYAQVSPDEILKIEEVDIVVGTSEKSRIADFVEENIKSHEKKNYVENIMSVRKFEEMEIDEYQDKTRAFLKIQDGCDRYCSYCLIPYARGPVRSRPLENIENEVEKLVSNGFKEVILSGIHISSYGKDLKTSNLVDVIESLGKIKGLERIRVGSIEPTFFTDEVLKRLKQVDKFCPHFHLSLQSGCDETLKRMNRKYTTSEYKSVVDRIRNVYDNPSITTDIIVGFPGEDDNEFNETYTFLSEIKLSKMHIFKYSERKGTKAEKLSDKVSYEKKEERSNILNELDLKNEEEFMKSFEDKVVNVLFEEPEMEYNVGYTSNYAKVHVHVNGNLRGEILPVTIKSCEKNYLIGEIEN